MAGRRYKRLGQADTGGGGGVTDHGALTGLADDDHTQYHTDARGDARYSALGHTHSYEPVLGNPASNGYILSSTTAGVRSWVAPPAGGGTSAIIAAKTASSSVGTDLDWFNFSSSFSTINLTSGYAYKIDFGAGFYSVADELGAKYRIRFRPVSGGSDWNGYGHAVFGVADSATAGIVMGTTDANGIMFVQPTAIASTAYHSIQATMYIWPFSTTSLIMEFSSDTFDKFIQHIRLNIVVTQLG